MLFKKHRLALTSGKAIVAVRIVRPGELKSDSRRQSAAEVLASLLHAPNQNLSHPNLQLISWEGPWSSYEHSLSNIFTKIERDQLFNPRQHVVESLTLQYELPRPSILFFIDTEQKGLPDRVAKAADEARAQLQGQPGPCLALNLESAQANPWPIPEGAWWNTTQEKADDCWAALCRTRHFNRFDWMCVYQNLPSVQHSRQPG